ncbi:MAG: hypothetical protein IMZ61_03205 [Planctomycetes bacterium]|nr:hypothetical protein [Planctomycetota bacterium]
MNKKTCENCGKLVDCSGYETLEGFCPDWQPLPEKPEPAKNKDFAKLPPALAQTVWEECLESEPAKESVCEDIACPFCGERDFDLAGLKFHLHNYCEVYKEVK